MKPSQELLNIVSCPVSGEKLEYNEQHNVVFSKKADIYYPVMDGIPLLLEKEAKKISASGLELESAPETV